MSRKLGLKCSTINCGSKPLGNKKDDRISQTPSRNMKNKVEAQPRKVNKKNRVVEPIRDVDVKHSLLNANFELICATLPPKKTTSHSVETQKPELKVYSKKQKNVKNVDIPSSSSLVMRGTVRFENDQIARIIGYGDYQLRNVTISRVYYVERLGHNLLSVGQFCDADLKVAF
ncbi:hypothetical protein Tco_1455188 [Tanacetum coccineum]